LNAVAAFFLWRQLLANQAALDEAAESSKAATKAAAAAVADTRPWIEIDVPEEAIFHVDNGGKAKLGCNIAYRNVGRTPALQCELHAVVVHAGPSGAIAESDIQDAYASIVREGSRLGQAIFPNRVESRKRSFDLDFTKAQRVRPILSLVLYVVTYRAHGETEWRATPVVRHLKDRTTKGAVVSLLPVERMIELMRTFDFNLEPI
jgi:hypothetical protein